MAVAAADFSTSIDSMSFGLMSASRFTVWSCDDDVEPVERVIDERPPGIDAFDTMMPSITYSGSP